MDKYKLTFIMNSLRRASYKWKGRWMAEKKYKHEGRNQYWCAVCGPDKVYGKKETQMDHVSPVVDPEKGFTTLDEWADRLFVYEEGWQRLCLPCHENKTRRENDRRAEVRLETKSTKVIKKKVKRKSTKKKPRSK